LKPKTVYIIFAILLSVLLVSLFLDHWLNKENAKINPVVEKIEPQPAVVDLSSSSIVGRSPAVVAGAAITVIKTLPKEKTGSGHRRKDH